MSDAEMVDKKIGEADKLTMDEFLRTLISQMFENDNDVATLTAVLQTTDGSEPPTIEVELRLSSINGTKTRSADDAADTSSK